MENQTIIHRSQLAVQVIRVRVSMIETCVTPSRITTNQDALIY